LCNPHEVSASKVKVCLYCGRGSGPGVKMSNEHVLGDWLGRRMAKPGQGMRSVRTGTRVTGSESQRLQPRLLDVRASAWDRKTNRVCRDCNSWSDRVIDEPIRETLLALMQGRPAFLCEQLAERIALWCAKTTVTATAADWGTDSPVPSYLANMIRAVEMPTPGLKVWIGCVDETAVTVDQALVAVPSREDAGRIVGQCVYTAVLAGRLFLYFRQCSNQAAEETVDAWQFAAPLRPFVTELYHWGPRSCRWPGPRSMSPEFALETLLPSLIPESWRTGARDEARGLWYSS
jgi:hypothetical protein